MKFELEAYHRDVSDNNLIADIKRVAGKLKKSPTQAEYNERGIYHSATFHRTLWKLVQSP